MYYNDYNLRQLLDLALRVPEIGAVNFNILYYILKTIIKNQGLEAVKPVFSLDEPLNAQSNSTRTEVTLKKSFSADSLRAINTDKEEYHDRKESNTIEKESYKWDKIKFSKRINAIDDELNEIHFTLAQLEDKTNFQDTVFGHLEKKLMKEIADVRQLVKSKLESLEDHALFTDDKLLDMDSKVSMLTTMKHKHEESSDEKDKYDETHLKKLGQEISSKLEKIDEEIILIKNQLQTETREKSIVESEPKYEKMSDKDTVSKSDIVEIGGISTVEREPKYEKINEKDADSKSDIVERGAKSAVEREPKYEKINDKDSVSKSDIVEIGGESTVEKEPKYEKTNDKDAVSKSDIVEIDQQLVNVSVELHKVLDRIHAIEQSCSKYDDEFQFLKDSCDEFVHSIEGLKENVVFLESEVTVLTELPGMKNRIEHLEEYVYSESDYKGTLKDSFIGEVEKELEHKESTAEDSEKIGIPDDAKRKFQTVLRDISLTQDMKKKKAPPKVKAEDLYRAFEEEDDYLDKEPEEFEKTEDDDFGESDEVPLNHETPKVKSDEKVKSKALGSPDFLEEYSRQIRGQVIVFVKKRLHDIEIDLHNIEANLSSMKEKMDNIEKYSKDLGEKLTFMDTNFHQRAGDLATLKEMTENHQVSIVDIMHHLDRKAEAYAVNQKVSRKELTVIEDRVLKLCLTTTSEISKLEEKIDSSIESFNIELDKKLFLEEFKLQYDFLLHKLKVIQSNLKDFSSVPPVFEFEGNRPVEIKKYVLSKNGMKQEQKKIVPFGSQTAQVSVIPLFGQSLPDREVSPRTEKLIQKTLESSSYRECKRFVGGAHTKIKVGKK